MTFQNIATPAIDAGADLLVDWLEFMAFFDEYGRARVDDLAGSERTQLEEPVEDIAAADQHDDRLREAIENEVTARRKALVCAYPFNLDEDGEELQFMGGHDQPAACFYLACLIASHVTGSPILVEPPSDDLVQRLRNRVFQVIGTLAVAGLVQGSAVSVGYPRETKEAILDVLRRAEEWGFGLLPRDKPGRHANPRAKDGGVDVIGWPSSDRPPPPAVWFGQLASGKKWEEKPVLLDYGNFVDDFLEGQGTGQHNFLTMIPFRLVDDLQLQRASKVHRYIADRCRAPLHALRALALPDRGIPLDEIQNVEQVVNWIREYRESVLAGQVA